MFFKLERKKIKRCRSAWSAYKTAFIEINDMLIKSSTSAASSHCVFGAYRKILYYERFCHTPRKRYDDGRTKWSEKTDWELYKIAYGDALKIFNQLSCVDRSEFREVYGKMPQRQKDFLKNMLYIIKFSAKGFPGNFDHRKALNFVYSLSRPIDHYYSSTPL